jgi:polyhydroxyalkanoate synthesis regulator phasin
MKLEAKARLSAAPSAPYKTQAKAVIKELMTELKEVAPDTWGEMPDNPLNNDLNTLRRACKAGLKASNAKIPKLARQAYGLLIAAEIYTPF